jgi:hypothetical protein
LPSGQGQGLSAAIYAALAWSFLSAMDGLEDVREGEKDIESFNTVLSLPYGELLLSGVGAAIFIAGALNVLHGVFGNFRRHLTGDSDLHRWTIPVARAGYFARGLVFLSVGFFLVEAAFDLASMQDATLAGAFGAIEAQPFGSLIAGLTGAGLVAFGLFGLVEARLPPHGRPGRRCAPIEPPSNPSRLQPLRRSPMNHLPPPARLAPDDALFLDLDGTLAPFAPTPEAVGPDGARTAVLRAACDALGGRLAVVSGRSLSEIDRILEGAVAAAAGVHGLELRFPDGRTEIARPHPALPQARARLEAFAKKKSALTVEDKDPGRDAALSPGAGAGSRGGGARPRPRDRDRPRPAARRQGRGVAHPGARQGRRPGRLHGRAALRRRPAGVRGRRPDGRARLRGRAAQGRPRRAGGAAARHRRRGAAGQCGGRPGVAGRAA